MTLDFNANELRMLASMAADRAGKFNDDKDYLDLFEKLNEAYANEENERLKDARI